MSRHHATLSWESTGVFLEDGDSKFGTLVLLRRPHILARGECFTLQCGRTLLEFFVESSWSIFPCFGKQDHQSEAGHKAKEESKSAPGDCLPDGGKHGLLLVCKKEYDRLLAGEERLRRRGSLLGIPPKSVMSTGLLRTPPPEMADALHRQRTVAYPMRKRIDVRMQEDSFIELLRGDTADDVDGCE